MKPETFDVVVVGAGPVGLCMAIDLAQHGLPVMLLDDVEVRNQGTLQVMNEKMAPRLTLQMTLSVLRERP